MRKYRHLAVILLILLYALPAVAQEVQIPTYSLESWREPKNDATQFAERLQCGWNLGNALECYPNAADQVTPENELDTETLWTSPVTTKEMLKAVRDMGYTSIRIPVTWHNHMDASLTISEVWMNRVQEVVDWALGLGFYVILDSHHDIGEDLIYPTNEKLNSSVKLLRAIWTGICERFQDYDERLIFQGMNEPRLRGTDFEWRFLPWDPDCSEAAECINRLNQEFVDVVRASGGNNETRYLMVSSYCNSPLTLSYVSFRLPKDSASNRLLVSTHCYLPSDFCMMADGTDYFDPEDEFTVKTLTDVLDPIYDKFVLMGVPLLIDEFGSTDKHNLESRVAYTALFCALARQRNIPCFLWDNNQLWAFNENFGNFDRSELTFTYPEIVKAQLLNGQ